MSIKVYDDDYKAAEGYMSELVQEGLHSPWRNRFIV